MSKVLAHAEMECRLGSSDKVYVVHVVEIAPGDYETNCYYGRRGSPSSTTQKYRGSDLTKAHAEARKIVSDKESPKAGKDPYERYTGSMPVAGLPAGIPRPDATATGIVSSRGTNFGLPATGGPAPAAAPVPASAPKAPLGPRAMLAEAISDDEAVPLQADASWAMQQKYDGVRVTVHIAASTIAAYNRDGNPYSLSDEVTTELQKLVSSRRSSDFDGGRVTHLDGELMGTKFVAYDIIVCRGNEVDKLPYIERYFMLEDLLTDFPAMLAVTAWTAAEKFAMMAQARAEDWEGVMYRNIDAAYQNIRTMDLRKQKFWATATCFVETVNTKRSVGLAMLDDKGAFVKVGNVTVAVNQDIPEAGTLVEVRYLYAHDGGSLYQPNLIRVRDDVHDPDPRSSLRRPPPEKRTA